MRVMIAALSLLVAACGFQPMYAPAGGGGAIGPVSIGEIEGKAGHVLRTELTRMLAVENSSGGEPASLEITLRETITEQGIRLDESATRAELRLTANYVLTPAPGQGRAIRGSLFTIVNYEIPTAAFGEITAQDDARERAAETMAQRFRSELALRTAQARAASTR
ncbi:MAG TPA: LPS assembly lipoprotein LptE [Terricaulis sp.]|nr:LPS assembly lipoprotein LptE [Terricaulis sp.]HRP11890.1 LPS assembly lipoprotein LptE [Terricaulis sp.]